MTPNAMEKGLQANLRAGPSSAQMSHRQPKRPGSRRTPNSTLTERSAQLTSRTDWPFSVSVFSTNSWPSDQIVSTLPRRLPRHGTFLLNHMSEIVAIDFFTVPTIRLRVRFVFLVLEHQRRRVQCGRNRLSVVFSPDLRKLVL
jgi:hypothetical protein